MRPAATSSGRGAHNPVAIIPLYVIMARLQLTDTRLILPYAAAQLPLAVFVQGLTAGAMRG